MIFFKEMIALCDEQISFISMEGQKGGGNNFMCVSEINESDSGLKKHEGE